MLQQLEKADLVRRELKLGSSQKRKAELGQFMTPSSIARFMASLFPASSHRDCRLLDAGAGVGALSCAFLDRCMTGELGFRTIDAFAYEIDDVLRKHLSERLSDYSGVRSHIFAGDFIELANQPLLHPHGEFTHAILNPPYKKINSSSSHRHALRDIGIETVNLYSAFVALAVAKSARGGQIVAIIPRSFCNGPYYRPFRDFILHRAAIQHIHLFKARNKAFKDDEVLQENVIIRLECNVTQGPVAISASTDDSFADFTTQEYPFEEIVAPDDTERFIQIPDSSKPISADLSETNCHSLSDLGIQVSTGPVVDFRMKEHLRAMPEADTVPLLYPCHFGTEGTEWPKAGSRKPNAIKRNEHTERWLYPNGTYCVVRRFSSKEEPRRIVASVVESESFKGVQMLGFENHLNVFHQSKRGISKELAYGLAKFLNTEQADEAFRRFNGHTQVNATDLKAMKYPCTRDLIQLGRLSMKTKQFNNRLG